MKGLDDAEHTYPFIDKDRECALGASYGGYMANWILGHSNRFKCIVSHDGTFNTESAWGTPKNSGSTSGNLKGRFMTIAKCIGNGRRIYRRKISRHRRWSFMASSITGWMSRRDSICSPPAAAESAVEMLYFPDEGHWVLKPQNSQLWYKTVNDWVDQWTKK